MATRSDDHRSGRSRPREAHGRRETSRFRGASTATCRSTARSTVEQGGLVASNVSAKRIVVRGAVKGDLGRGRVDLARRGGTRRRGHPGTARRDSERGRSCAGTCRPVTPRVHRARRPLVRRSSKQRRSRRRQPLHRLLLPAPATEAPRRAQRRPPRRLPRPIASASAKGAGSSRDDARGRLAVAKARSAAAGGARAEEGGQGGSQEEGVAA